MNSDNELDSFQTIQRLKSVIKEFQKMDNSQETINEKRLAISENLYSTIEMLGDSNGGTFSYISSILNEYMTNIKIEMLLFENSLIELKNSYNTDKVMKQDFVEKNHIFRQSLLSTMFFNDQNFRAIYYLALSYFLWLVVWVIADDYNTAGMFDYNRILSNFDGFSIVFFTWLGMFTYSLVVIFYIKIIEFWSTIRNEINYKIIIIIYLIYQIFLYFVVSLISFNSNITMVNRIIIGCEMARFSLKIHSYFREKLLYGLKRFHLKIAVFSPQKKDVPEDKMPQIEIDSISLEFKRYIFFSFCPSLIYRDKYPQLINYRFDMILAHFTNFLLCFFFFYILLRYICSPYFTSMKLRNYYSLAYFCYDCFKLAIPGTFYLMAGFFLILHTWLNLWSEILRFGDRRFYEDWWNCTNFEEWYRKWNMVVHEWLYYYVYNDVVRFLGTNSRLLCKIMVFLLSVIIHEIIVWQSIGFFFPILSLFFGGPGIVFTYIKPKKKQFNILFWIKLFIGIGILFCLFLREFFLRSIIDNELGLDYYWHSYIPRSLLIYYDSYRVKIEKSNKY